MKLKIFTKSLNDLFRKSMIQGFTFCNNEKDVFCITSNDKVFIIESKLVEQYINNIEKTYVDCPQIALAANHCLKAINQKVLRSIGLKTHAARFKSTDHVIIKNVLVDLL